MLSTSTRYIRLLVLSAIPVTLNSKQSQSLILPSQKNSPAPRKFAGYNRLKRSVLVRSYKGIYGKVFLCLELSFMLYAWIFNSFGTILSLFGLGFFFSPIFNVSFLRTVFLQRKGSICREASKRLGENERAYVVLFESGDEIVVQWKDTGDVAHLSRKLGVWRIQSLLTNVKDIEQRFWQDEDFRVRERVLHGDIDAAEVYDATREEFERSQQSV